ncbi:MAG TPA: ATP-binding cassette domain-containing protein [Candidatus Acidoferrales bacterium]|nr:ATP-binding cassette domain-containing protein [Candidatus Acidoferrales bacterium]
MATDPKIATAPVIEFRDVQFRVAEHIILKHLSFEVRRGETLVLLGRSGSGKTTALRLVNRLLEPTAGEVCVEGQRTLDQDPIRLRRQIGYVIQESGLFPHFTVERNIALVPHLENWEKGRVSERVHELLRLFGLEPSQFARRYPRELSGGQRQRVGVARALAADPPILLMDEPFGALDLLTRTKIQREFLALQHEMHKTILFVTHDVGEALLLGTRIALLEAGELMGVYTPGEFLHSSEPIAAAYVSAFRAGIVQQSPEKRGVE